jgi:hypothetical protein
MFFDTLSIRALHRFSEVLRRLESELPGAISDWNEPFRPRFYVVFELFKQKLAERIEQLKREERHPVP